MDRPAAATSATARDIILEIVRNMREGLEPLHYSTLAPAIYHVYLHPDDMERLRGIVPRIVDEARRALDAEMESLNRSGLAKRLKLARRGEPKVAAPEGGWQIRILENTDDDVDAMHLEGGEEFHQAVLEGGEWVINGTKQFISNGYDASLYVVYANTNNKVGMQKGTSSFLVPRETPGLNVTHCNETIGGRFMNNGEIVFDNCRVPADHLLVRDDALGKAGIYFRPGKILVAAKSLGIGLGAYEETVSFVHERVQGGKVLIKHQAVALRIADMATRLEAVAALLRHAAMAVDERSPDADALCNMVKVFASQEIVQVCRHAMELHGGYGAMLEVGIEKYMRDALINLHSDGTSDVSNFKIVRAMFPETAGSYAGAD